ncbi:MAG: mechanosensitive ion channel family protein [Gemmatimonadota bacterium]
MNLDTVLLGNALRQWLIAAGILLLVGAALWAFHRFVVSRFTEFARRTTTGIDDIVAHVLGKTKVTLIFFVALFLASLWLTLPGHVPLILRRAAQIAIIVQAGVWTNAAIGFWVDRFRERQLLADAAAVTTVSALAFVGRLVVWVIVFLLLLDNLGVEVTALLAGLGIGGIAVALAVQNILGDLFASLSIVLDKPFVIGDFLNLGVEHGTVEHIGLKTTRLRSLSGEQIAISNGELLRTRIRNFGRMFERRALFSIGVTYQTPRDKLELIPTIIREAIERHENTRFERSHFKQYGAYSLDFETVFFVTQPEYNAYMDVQQAVNLEIHRRFEEEGIEFAYPTQVVYALWPDGGEPPASAVVPADTRA